MIPKKRYINYAPLPAAVAAAGAGAGSGAAAGAGSAASAAGWASVGASSLDAIGGQAFGIANLIMQAKQLQYQNAWNEKVYEEQKMLADPAYRMQRLRAAGLNPYGDYTTPMTSAATQAPDATGVGNALNGLAGSLSNSTAKVFQALSTKLAFKQLELEQKKTDYGIKLTDQQIKQLTSVTAYQDIVNEIAEATKGSQIELSKAQVDKLFSEILLNNLNAEWLPERLKAEINKLNADTALTNYNWQTYMPAMLLLNRLNGYSQRALNSSIISKNAAEVSKMAEEVNNLRLSGAGVKELKKYIDNMPDGISKTFMTMLLLFFQANTNFGK